MKNRIRLSLIGLTVVMATFIAGGVAASPQAEAAVVSVPMYRVYNPNSGEHFYTADDNERRHLVSVGWVSEGVGWYAPASGDPVYRLYNPNAGDHHYTPAVAERDFLVKVGWKYEGVGWASSTDAAARVPLYRAYNPNARAGSHNYTTNWGEQHNLTSLGWKDEGIAWYATAPGGPAPTNPTPVDPTPEDKNCSDFTYQQDAQAWFDAHPVEAADLDGNGDGEACESLPLRPGTSK
ncbi:MAG: excalibur calcium-binding domain-containing protein [Propionibacteriaceae bacterium]|jgi:hypothetical protein|nr:excalibur calcium-binding domain-containing protein [Propionibacteriaceae bacterium]